MDARETAKEIVREAAKTHAAGAVRIPVQVAPNNKIQKPIEKKKTKKVITMRKIFPETCIIILQMLNVISISAQPERVEAYFTTREMPDMMKFLPAPPAFDSPLFINDSIRYLWGKEMRKDAGRMAIAIRDADYGLHTIINEFSAPFGLQISQKDTPKIYKLLKESLATCDSICTLPKARYMRTRPYVRYKEHTLVVKDEESHRNNGSYPSGHTILGWSAALLLMEINPEAQDTLLARGYMFGESRIIAGYHWQSDVDAARTAASAAYAKLHTSKRFLKHMKSARKEFLRKRELSK